MKLTPDGKSHWFHDRDYPVPPERCDCTPTSVWFHDPETESLTCLECGKVTWLDTETNEWKVKHHDPL